MQINSRQRPPARPPPSRGSTTSLQQRDRHGQRTLLQIYAANLYLSSNGCTLRCGRQRHLRRHADGGGHQQQRRRPPRRSSAAPPAGPAGRTRPVIAGRATNRTTTPTTTGWRPARAERSCSSSARRERTRRGRSWASRRRPSTGTTSPTTRPTWRSTTLSGGGDVIYVRDADGAPLYSWTDPMAGETIMGTPQWITTARRHRTICTSRSTAAPQHREDLPADDTAPGRPRGR